MRNSEKAVLGATFKILGWSRHRHLAEVALKRKKNKHETKRTKACSSPAAGPRSVNIDVVEKNVDSSISRLLALLELFF